VLGGEGFDGAAFGIASEVRGGEALDRGEYGWRASQGVLVEVETQ
jgi:hypothetical protein